jgi:hypothetical protein
LAFHPQGQLRDDQGDGALMRQWAGMRSSRALLWRPGRPLLLVEDCCWRIRDGVLVLVL